jgi:hypothetical protein
MVSSRWCTTAFAAELMAEDAQGRKAEDKKAFSLFGIFKRKKSA